MDDEPQAVSDLLEDWREDASHRVVDLVFVRGKSYRARVRRAVGPRAAKAVHRGIVRMLGHRSGTSYEDLYVYDLRDGSLIGSTVTARVPKRVEFTDGLRVATSFAVKGGTEVVIVYNHPDSMPPSAPDILSLEATGAKRGVIACHDGSLYVFEIVGEPAPGYTIDNDRVDRIQELWGADEARLLRAFRDEPGVHIEHIR